MMNGSTLKDHITSESLLNKHNLLSANQLAAERKIAISLEFQYFELKNVWKFNLWNKNKHNSSKKNRKRPSYWLMLDVILSYPVVQADFNLSKRYQIIFYDNTTIN